MSSNLVVRKFCSQENGPLLVGKAFMVLGANFESSSVAVILQALSLFSHGLQDPSSHSLLANILWGLG